MAEDAGAFAEELTTVFTEEDDCTAFADELAGFVAELLAIFAEDEDGGRAAEELLATFTEELLTTAEDFGAAADELFAILAELLSAFAEDDSTTTLPDTGFASPSEVSEQHIKARAIDTTAAYFADFFNNINTPYSKKYCSN